MCNSSMILFLARCVKFLPFCNHLLQHYAYMCLYGNNSWKLRFGIFFAKPEQFWSLQFPHVCRKWVQHSRNVFLPGRQINPGAIFSLRSYDVPMMAKQARGLGPGADVGWVEVFRKIVHVTKCAGVLSIIASSSVPFLRVSRSILWEFRAQAKMATV